MSDNLKYLKKWKLVGWKRNTGNKQVDSTTPKYLKAFQRVLVRNPNYEPTLKTIKVDDYLQGSIYPIAKTDKAHREAYRDTLSRVSLAAHRAGYGKNTAKGKLSVSSSYRTRAEQQRLYELYKKGMGALAAPAGTSMHERGLAVDVPKARDMKDFIKECWKLGLLDDVPSEKWHLTNHQWGKK